MTGSNPFGPGGHRPPAQSGFPPAGAGHEAWSPFGSPSGGNSAAQAPTGGYPGSQTTMIGPAGFDGGFDDRPTPSLQVGTPPLLWLGLALVCAAGGLALVLLAPAPAVGTFPALAVLAWVVAGPVAIGLLAVFLTKDTGLRARSFYAAPAWLPWAYRVVLLVAVVAVIISALQIAEWAGRR